MDIHEYHKRLIMENVFDGISSVFPLSIIPVENKKIISRYLVGESLYFSMFNSQTDWSTTTLFDGAGMKVRDDIILYSGVHFVSPTTLLSLIQPKHTMISAYFDRDGAVLNSVLDPRCSIIFLSIDIGMWCEHIIEASSSSSYRTDKFAHCHQPYIYRDKQFEEFERIAMKFPMYNLIASEETRLPSNNNGLPPSRELIAELDKELLRLRCSLL